jgi:hypothetical protein
VSYVVEQVKWVFADHLIAWLSSYPIIQFPTNLEANIISSIFKLEELFYRYFEFCELMLDIFLVFYYILITKNEAVGE